MQGVKKAIIGMIVLVSLFTNFSVFAQDEPVELLTDEEIAECIYDPDEPAPILLGGARPSSVITSETTLLSQPPLTADTRLLEIITIPVNARVVVIDLDDQTQTYYRIIWPCGGYNFTGWIDIQDVNHNPRRTNPKPAPPGCAEAVQVVDLMDDVWISPVNGRIAVVVDLYRETKEGKYPRSSYYITRDGRELRDRERLFESSGTILINGVVMGVEVRRGSILAFSVLPEPEEDLNFFGILYYVSEDCEFGN